MDMALHRLNAETELGEYWERERAGEAISHLDFVEGRSGLGCLTLAVSVAL